MTDNPILTWLNNLPPVSVDPFVLRRTSIELIPVGELIAALKAIAGLPSAPAYSDHPGHIATVTGYNTALSDVRTAIIDAIEALHDHDEAL